MDSRTAKRRADEAGLELYYDAQWRTWGLIDPTCMSQEESEWMSSADLREITPAEFEARINIVLERQRRGQELAG